MTAQRFTDDHELPVELAAAWRADAVRISERPEEFWNGQQARIRARIRDEGVRHPRRLWLAVATGMLIFFALLLTNPAGPPPQEARPHAAIDDDQELLLSVEHALAAGTPKALEPVTLLVESNSNHAVETSHKEHRHED